MARVSGWYKRHVRSVSLVVGLVLVLSFNLNVLSIARSIYTDQALRGSVVTQATQASQCGSKDPATCLADIRAEIDRVRGDGLPIGWAEVQACSAPHADCNWPEQKGLWGHGHQFPQAAADVLLLLLGWGLMVIALLPGARFWFDALSQLGSLRSTGPKPTTATPQGLIDVVERSHQMRGRTAATTGRRAPSSRRARSPAPADRGSGQHPRLDDA